jgi:DNA-binding NarL/FixJ family response regulator
MALLRLASGEAQEGGSRAADEFTLRLQGGVTARAGQRGRPAPEVVVVLVSGFSPLTERGIAEVLRGAPGVTVVESGAGGGVLQRQLRVAAAVVALVDSEGDGSLLAEVRRLRSDMGVVMLVGELCSLQVRIMRAAGVSSLSRETSAEHLMAVRCAAQGGQASLVGNRIVCGDQDRGGFLTPRELSVLALTCERSSVREIASTFGISVETVRKHTASLRSKLEIGSRRHLEGVQLPRALRPAGN